MIERAPAACGRANPGGRLCNSALKYNRYTCVIQNTGNNKLINHLAVACRAASKGAVSCFLTTFRNQADEFTFIIHFIYFLYITTGAVNLLIVIMWRPHY